MASIVPAVTTLNNGLLKLGAGSSTYEQALESFQVTASTPTTVVKTVAGGPFAYAGTPAYSVVLKALQDIATTGSLQNYLNTVLGQQIAFLWTQGPGTTGSKTIAGTILVIAPDFGGDVDKPLDFSLTLPMVGAPTYGTAP